MYNPLVPYNDLPVLPPPESAFTPDVLKETIGASRTLATLQGAGRLVPNQAIILRALVLQEAHGSSEIEDLHTTSDELYRGLEGDENKVDPATKEVLRYAEAVWTGAAFLQEKKPINRDLIRRLAQIIKGPDCDFRTGPGTVIRSGRANQVIYTPPSSPEVILDRIKNLGQFLHGRSSIDPLLRALIGHYQFEAIHPFPDGNGRVGRVILALSLVQSGLLDQPILFLSRGILKRKSEYYAALRGVTERQDWQTYLIYMVKVLAQTAKQTTSTLQEIHDAIEDACQIALREMSRGYSRELVEVVFSQPYTRIGTLERQGIAKRQTASVYLQELARIGILEARPSGREMLYYNQTLMSILTQR